MFNVFVFITHYASVETCSNVNSQNYITFVIIQFTNYSLLVIKVQLFCKPYNSTCCVLVRISVMSH